MANYSSRLAETLGTKFKVNGIPPVIKTPPSAPIKGREKDMVLNNAGGYVFKVTSWEFLDRFLILGTEGGTYYVGEKKLTEQNFNNVKACMSKDWKRAIDRVVEVSTKGLAKDNDPALLVLAYAASLDNTLARKYALNALPQVARIGTHLFHFVTFLRSFRGMGRLVKDALSKWYKAKTPQALAYQIVKYKSRDGWSHRDVLRLVRPKPVSKVEKALYEYAVKGTTSGDTPAIILASEALMKTPGNIGLAKRFIKEYNLSWEMLPTEMLTNTDIWTHLVLENGLGLQAIIRNLGRMTRIGTLKPMNKATEAVVERLNDAAYIKASRLHPISNLIALKAYELGYPLKGKGVPSSWDERDTSLSWVPVPAIQAALEQAFYKSFDNVVPTGKRNLYAIDVSGSMTGSYVPGTNITANTGAAALAMVLSRTEKNSHILGFCHEFRDLGITPTDSLSMAMKKTYDRSFGATNCSLPMLHAMKQKWNVDNFVVITDNETFLGSMHPSEALKQYRRSSGIEAKLAVIGMTATKCSIADPDDAGMMDFVGFSADLPKALSYFFTGMPEGTQSNED
jgi:60 kDa SS-A/Ro ribonucleoprotein